MRATTEFTDEDTNPERLIPLHPEVIEWAENMVKAAKHFRHSAEVIGGFERLAELARGGR